MIYYVDDIDVVNEEYFFAEVYLYLFGFCSLQEKERKKRVIAKERKGERKIRERQKLRN